MSNNIYDILKKMAGLEAPKQTLTEGKKAKPDFADLDRDGNKKEPMKKAAKEKDKGAIAEAVAQVERQLNEKYMGFKKKMSEERKEIPISVIDGPGGYKEEQGRINKHEASKVKRQEMPGRELPPIEDRYTKPDGNKDQKVQRQEIPGPELPPVDNRSKPADKPKTKAVDESGLQAYLGKKKYGEQGMRALQKAGREGASKEKMALLRAKHDKMDEGNYNEDMLSPKQQKIARMAGNPDKIDANDLKALRAGKHKKAEGNAFSGALDAARDAGKNSFKVGGKSYPVQEETGEERDAAARRENERYDNARNYQGRNARGDVIRSGGEVVRGNPTPPSMMQRVAGTLGLPNTAKDALGDPLYKSSRPAGGGGGGGGGSGGGGVSDTRDMQMGAELDPKAMMQRSMREGKKSMREGWDEMQKYLEKKRGPESKGGAGKKAGTRYGGSAQRDDDEETDGEGQPVAKKKGRPKGTGGGAKFSFKKPKD